MLELAGLALLLTNPPSPPAPRLGPVYVDPDVFPGLHIVVERSLTSEPLRAADLRLIEESEPAGSAEQLYSFRRMGYPLAILVLLDVSGSMRGRPLNAVQTGLSSFVDRAREQDRIAVASFADEFRWEAKWEDSRAHLRRCIDSLQARGSRSRLHDAVRAALDAFRGSETSTLPARRRILLISDGFDEGSNAKWQELLEEARQRRTPIDTIGIANPGYQRWDVLQRLSAASVGYSKTAADRDGLRTHIASGIDVLLDTPVALFTARQLRLDGARHSLGVEFIGQDGSRKRDFVTVSFPSPSLWRRMSFWLALVAVAAALKGAWEISIRLRRRLGLSGAPGGS